MNTMLCTRLLTLLGALALLSACGGGDVAVTPATDLTDSEAVAVAGLNGIWEGDYTDSSGIVCSDVKGLIYNGSVRAISEDCNIVFAGILSLSSSDAGISFILFDSEGSRTGQSEFSGSYTLQSLVEGSLDNGGQLSLRYDTVYENDSSLALLEATWGFEETINTGTVLNIFSIDNAGSLSSLLAASGCDYSASFSLLDADKNLYAVSLSISTCPASLASRNGSYSGVATLSGNNRIMTILAGNEQSVFFADFTRISGVSS